MSSTVELIKKKFSPPYEHDISFTTNVTHLQNTEVLVFHTHRCLNKHIIKVMSPSITHVLLKINPLWTTFKIFFFFLTALDKEQILSWS